MGAVGLDGVVEQAHGHLDRHDLALLDVRVDHLAHPARDGFRLEKGRDPELRLLLWAELLPDVIWRVL